MLLAAPSLFQLPSFQEKKIPELPALQTFWNKGLLSSSLRGSVFLTSNLDLFTQGQEKRAEEGLLSGALYLNSKA